MTKALLEDAFRHHVWATLRLIDACLLVRPAQLRTAVPGTYGSILQTMRHLVQDDAWHLFTMTADRATLIDESQMGLTELRAAMERNGAALVAAPR